VPGAYGAVVPGTYLVWYHTVPGTTTVVVLVLEVIRTNVKECARPDSSKSTVPTQFKVQEPFMNFSLVEDVLGWLLTSAPGIGFDLH
jgi:hypothetical protein